VTLAGDGSEAHDDQEADMLDAVMGYLQVASGLTDVTKSKATATAKSLLGDGGLSAASDKVNVGQVQSLAEELVAASKANRELLLSLVRAEVDRAVGALGLASRDDVAALRRQVERLQRDVTESKSGGPARTATKATRATKATTRTTKPRGTKTPTKAPTRAAAPKAAAPSTPAAPAPPADGA
jgi:hypothetical protein